MDNILYRKVTVNKPNEGLLLSVTLTKEVNRLVVWQVVTVGEDDTFSVLKTFYTFETNEALEWTVEYANGWTKTRDALSSIASLLDSMEWNSDTASQIAEILRGEGFSIDDPEPLCQGCQRPESVCSAAPCEAVKKDRAYLAEEAP